MTLLESAVHRQHTSLGGTLKYPEPIENAATLTFGLCNDHPFHNGNKRTSLVAMLVHLDRNKLTLYEDVGQKQLFEMILDVAQHSLGRSHRRVEEHTRRNADEEVHSITEWIRRRAARVRRGERQITYRELRRILGRFGYRLDNPHGNAIDVARLESREKGLFKKSLVTVRKHVGTIGFPGDNRFVPLKVLKQVRVMCKLCEEDGVDTESFYDEAALIDAFVNRYRTILRRLARR
jgi:death-on-curing protein